MDYQKHYNSLVVSRKQRGRTEGEYYESHHILPRSMGGNNKRENLVYLTAREHFIAHWLLWRIHRNRKMALAFFAMCHFKPSVDRKMSSRAYAEAREAFANERKGEKNNNYGPITGKRKQEIIESNHKRKGSTHRGKYEVIAASESETLTFDSVSAAQKYFQVNRNDIASGNVVQSYKIEIRKLERITSVEQYSYKRKGKKQMQLEEFDWKEIQRLHDEGERFSKLRKRFRLFPRIEQAAKDAGLLVRR